jgi:hypothetical protein
MKKIFSVFISLILLQLNIADTVHAKSSGSINCSSISRSDSKYSKKLIIQEASLSIAEEGFNLSLKIQGRKDNIKYKVSSDMIVKGTDYSSNGGGELDSKLSVKKNGAFSFTDMPRSQQICTVKGTLIFGQGVKQKIFGTG